MNLKQFLNILKIQTLINEEKISELLKEASTYLDSSKDKIQLCKALWNQRIGDMDKIRNAYIPVCFKYIKNEMSKVHPYCDVSNRLINGLVISMAVDEAHDNPLYEGYDMFFKFDLKNSDYVAIAKNLNDKNDQIALEQDNGWNKFCTLLEKLFMIDLEFIKI